MTEFFPGSRLRVTPPAGIPDEHQIPRGKIFTIRGVEIELLSISDLAKALRRDPVTIRKWERKRYIPPATYVKSGVNGDVRGRRRLYSRAQVEAMVRIAAEEKILYDEHKHISRTRFTTKVFAAFKELQR